MNIRKSMRGVTLTELMIVVAIIGIIAAIGYPSYQNYTRETRREAAKATLTAAASKFEQYFLNTKTYNTTFTALGLSSVTDGGYYNLTAVGTANTYTLTATPTGTQTSDSCGTMTLTQGGNNTPANCW